MHALRTIEVQIYTKPCINCHARYFYSVLNSLKENVWKLKTYKESPPFFISLGGWDRLVVILLLEHAVEREKFKYIWNLCMNGDADNLTIFWIRWKEIWKKGLKTSIQTSMFWLSCWVQPIFTKLNSNFSYKSVTT